MILKETNIDEPNNFPIIGTLILLLIIFIAFATFYAIFVFLTKKQENKKDSDNKKNLELSAENVKRNIIDNFIPFIKDTKKTLKDSINNLEFDHKTFKKESSDHINKILTSNNYSIFKEKEFDLELSNLIENLAEKSPSTWEKHFSKDIERIINKYNYE